MLDGLGELLAALGSAAGYVVAIALLLLIVGALIRGDLVPGYIHRREIEKGDEARRELNDERAKDEAAAAAAAVAERAASAVIRLQRAGDVADERHEPT